MRVELNPEERDVLIHLLDEAIRDLGPEIRHTMTSTYKDDLKQHRRVLRGLRERLVVSEGAQWPTAPFTSTDPIGTA